ncbi:MAG: exonuclease SbcCD subunit D C-terminal domain-containing protein [Desulfatibacillum sp.]|nr:exonuclease SbcCD subunit D C-terminal domain-containing protein [Desulfatibacillum sp.]
MKLLHTSDWHLGRSLYGRKRYDEFKGFLDWLMMTIREHSIDALLVSGDIFDTGTPSNRAQELYYQFLSQVFRSDCRHVVITAGNHDSPTFLDAPKTLLRHQNIHVVGGVGASSEDEVLVLKDAKGQPELIVCAVPYLRDRDIRLSEAGESMEDKAQKLVMGVKKHYNQVCRAAVSLRDSQSHPLPIVAMGHLFTAGGDTIKEDGVRDLYVGSLGHVGADIFPSEIDYLALGHLHIPQKAGGLDHFRYSGSPLPMSFGEANHQKIVLEVDFEETRLEIRELPVPRFQELQRIRGNLDNLIQVITRLKETGSNAWLEIECFEDVGTGLLQETVKSLIEGTGMEIIRTGNSGMVFRILGQEAPTETLNDLSEEDVFVRCMEAKEVPEIHRPELLGAFREVLASLNEQDVQAE